MARLSKAEQRARDLQVLELRVTGLGFDAIASQLGFASKAGACKAFHRALAEGAPEDLQQARRLAEARLDRLLAAVWAQADRGDLAAVDRVLRIEVRRARLRQLDEPKAVMPRPGDRELELDDDETGTVVQPGRLAALRERRREQEAARG